MVKLMALVCSQNNSKIKSKNQTALLLASSPKARRSCRQTGSAIPNFSRDACPAQVSGLVARYRSASDVLDSCIQTRTTSVPATSKAANPIWEMPYTSRSARGRNWTPNPRNLRRAACCKTSTIWTNRKRTICPATRITTTTLWLARWGNETLLSTAGCAHWSSLSADSRLGHRLLEECINPAINWLDWVEGKRRWVCAECWDRIEVQKRESNGV